MTGSAAERDAQPRRFRPPPWMLVLSAASALLFVVLAGGMYGYAGWTWVTAAAVVLALVAVCGLADALTTRVDLAGEHLVIVHHFRRRRYPRAALVKVTWARGAPVALQDTSGQWVQLPEVGAGSQAMADTLRAWIRK